MEWYLEGLSFRFDLSIKVSKLLFYDIEALSCWRGGMKS